MTSHHPLPAQKSADNRIRKETLEQNFAYENEMGFVFDIMNIVRRTKTGNATHLKLI